MCPKYGCRTGTCIVTCRCIVQQPYFGQGTLVTSQFTENCGMHFDSRSNHYIQGSYSPTPFVEMHFMHLVTTHAMHLIHLTAAQGPFQGRSRQRPLYWLSCTLSAYWESVVAANANSGLTPCSLCRQTCPHLLVGRTTLRVPPTHMYQTWANKLESIC